MGRRWWWPVGLAAVLGAMAPAAPSQAAPASPSRAAPAPAVRAAPASGLTSLDAQVLQALSTSTASEVAFRADIAGLGTISLNPTEGLLPASNNKLLVGETALQQLGPGFRFVTGVYSSAPIRHGVIHGWLGIRSSGDPSLTTAELASLAAELHGLGLRHVTGYLLLDDTKFSVRDTAPGWKPGFTPQYCGPISGFAVDENSWRTDPQYLAHPDMGNLSRWRTLLKKAGITVRGHEYVRRFYTTRRPLVLHRSGPLSSIVGAMLTWSDNFIAEMLLDDVGLAREGHGDLLHGLAAVQAEARALKVGLLSDVDGSGLSYDDSESPDSLVGWLEASMRTPSGPVLKAGLPVACETGTLKTRMCWKGVAGRVEAKTGSLDYVHTLSGFTTTASGRNVVFSILLNATTNDTSALDSIDHAVAVLALSQY